MLGLTSGLVGGRFDLLLQRVIDALMAIPLLVLVLAVVAPSGLVMAREATAGPIAAFGFVSLSFATAVCAAMALYCARTQNFQSHQRWATRCFILLASPLLLRLISGALIVLGQESEWGYRLNAWLSWFIPLAIYEVWLRCWSSRDGRYNTTNGLLKTETLQ